MNRLNETEMNEAERKEMKERWEKVKKLRKSLNEYTMLESTSYNMLPTDVTTAMVMEAASCVCAATATLDDPRVAFYFLEFFEEKVVSGLVQIAARKACENG